MFDLKRLFDRKFSKKRHLNLDAKSFYCASSKRNLRRSMAASTTIRSIPCLQHIFRSWKFKSGAHIYATSLVSSIQNRKLNVRKFSSSQGIFSFTSRRIFYCRHIYVTSFVFSMQERGIRMAGSQVRR